MWHTKNTSCGYDFMTFSFLLRHDGYFLPVTEMMAILDWQTLFSSISRRTIFECSSRGHIEARQCDDGLLPLLFSELYCHPKKIILFNINTYNIFNNQTAFKCGPCLQQLALSNCKGFFHEQGGTGNRNFYLTLIFYCFF